MDPEIKKKHSSYLDEFQILRTLGQGYQAQVKLGRDDNGNLYAIKKYRKETANLATLTKELEVLKQLQHQNLVRLVGVRDNATYKRKDESIYNCFVIILEYVGGGELFDFIAQTGRFSEKVTRTYFHQMMNGLNYVHTRGYAHRDLKPENILLTTDFVLKLADFGLSCSLKGRDGSGFLRSIVGTEYYMAPEVEEKKYDGAKVDIFAAGVILFIMYTGKFPFYRSSNDGQYRKIKEKNFESFWKTSSNKKVAGFFSDSFKDLFQKMVAFNPQERPSLQQISVHPWVIGQTSTAAEVKHQFEKRLQVLEANREKKRQEQQAKRENHIQNELNSDGVRGDLETESPFLTIYEQQKEISRELGKLEPINPDDFKIAENVPYAVALLKDFCKNTKIQLDKGIEEDEETDEDSPALTAVEVNEGTDTISIKYEISFNVDGEDFTDQLEVAVKFGHSQDANLSLCLSHISGNRLYFKKVAKKIKDIYIYCLK